MHIKICGLTNRPDVLAAVDAGADYLGFNFYPRSPRYVTPEACAQLVDELARRDAAVTTVGIFVNEPAAEVALKLDYCGLDLAQLHGDETLEQLTRLRGRAFKALRGANTAAETLDALAAGGPGRPAFLLDAAAPLAYGAAPEAYGGTGQVGDWPAAAQLARRYPLFLAGGLNPGNVAAAIEAVRPWGVDVASGVESAPGRKDHAKITAFVQAARAAAPE
ncbi:MAG: phosphoribosylanthranilate isomerase [Anaerolineales bacterium]|nr:phosphoribosylanthranilate isomerase [Anaerolineales bacterium]